MVTLAVTAETADETRVALSPDTAKRFVALGRCEVGAQIEQVVLDARQHGVEFGVLS